MADYTKEPRITSSKQACVCAETGVNIAKYERVLFNPTTKLAYCIKSNKYKEFIEQKRK